MGCSNLNLKWQQFYGGDAAYFLWGLKATQDGGCLMAATRYDADIQNFELDVFILKVDSAGLLTSTNNYPSIPVNQLAVYPNPARDFVRISYPDFFSGREKVMLVYNSPGNLVHQIPLTSYLSEAEIDISEFPAGLYYLVLKADGKTEATGKFVKAD